MYIAVLCNAVDLKHMDMGRTLAQLEEEGLFIPVLE
jgi:hypothetical protein